MVAEKLIWCCRQKKGVKLIVPSSRLANEYLESAEETLAVMRAIEGKSEMWLATTNYYCRYFAAYALLMRTGIRSEIHECTIELCELLESEGLLPFGCSKALRNDKQLRQDNQYYLKKRKVLIDFNQLRELITFVRNKANTMTSDEITSMREKLANLFG